MRLRRLPTRARFQDDHIIVRAFNLAREHCGSATFACERAGIHKDFLGRARRGDKKFINLLSFEAVLNKCGYKLEIVKIKERDIP